jgi:tetratricopeptide (TPR) repeat protein
LEDDDRELALPAEPGPVEAQPGEERAAPFPRRLVLHGMLALLATPLPGGLLLGARAIAARRVGAGLFLMAAALAVTGLGVGIGLLVPVSLGPAAAAIYLLWLAAGLAAGWVETRAGLAPEVPWTDEPRTGVQVLTWSAAVAVVGVLVAFGLATMTTRWGDEIFAKPSGPRQALLMILLVLAPVGAVTGLVLGALRRPFRLGTPVVFAASFYFVGLALVAAEALFKWLARGLSRTEELVVSNSLAGSSDAWLLVVLCALYLAAALYLAESRRTLELIQRWAAVAALAFLVFWSFDVAAGDGPVSWRNRWATTTAGEGRHADAARHWAWAVTRAPRDGVTAGLALKGAREALLAGDPDLARTLLSRIDAELVRQHPGGLEAGTAKALLASRMHLGAVRSIKIAPVFQEGSLDTRWSALLTAARAVRPDLGETEVKQKLQDLASSASSTDLPGLRPLQQLRVVADLFGARAVAFPWSARDRVLAAGVPVLVRVPPTGHWILVFWSAPGADAVIALDYSLWGVGEKEDMDQDEAARLLVGSEGPESRAARAQARVGVLLSASQLGAVLSRDGGGIGEGGEGGVAFALVSPRQASLALPDLPADLTTLELARREMERKAFGRGLALAAQLPPGPARDELLAWAWLDPEGRRRLAGEEASAQAIASRLADRAGSASPWLVEELVSQTWDAREPFCALRESVLRASLVLRPAESWPVLELEKKAAAAGRSAEASGLALRSAASHNWASAFVLEALEPLALMPNVGSDPRARVGLERLLDRVPPLVGSQSKASDYTLRSIHPEYWAARAALARDPDDAAERWRRAVELKPKSARYRLRLAEALERAGRTEEAREARRWADAVQIEPLCPGMQP